MQELDYRTKTERGTIKKKYVLHGKTYSDPASYYGAVYEDIVSYKRIDTEKIKTDSDLKQFLEKDPKISDKLITKLQRTDVHREIINQNLKREGKYQLKNKKTVNIAGKIRIKQQDIYYYKDMVVVAKKERTSYRDIRTGRFISLK